MRTKWFGAEAEWAEWDTIAGINHSFRSLVLSLFNNNHNKQHFESKTFLELEFREIVFRVKAKQKKTLIYRHLYYDNYYCFRNRVDWSLSKIYGTTGKEWNGDRTLRDVTQTGLTFYERRYRLNINELGMKSESLWLLLTTRFTDTWSEQTISIFIWISRLISNIKSNCFLQSYNTLFIIQLIWVFLTFDRLNRVCRLLSAILFRRQTLGLSRAIRALTRVPREKRLETWLTGSRGKEAKVICQPYGKWWQRYADCAPLAWHWTDW